VACSVGGLIQEYTCFWRIEVGSGWVPYALCGMVIERSRFGDWGVDTEMGRSVAVDAGLGSPSCVDGVWESDEHLSTHTVL